MVAQDMTAGCHAGNAIRKSDGDAMGRVAAMALPTIFQICEPRDDVIRGTIQDPDFAADLKQVITGEFDAKGEAKGGAARGGPSVRVR